MATPTPAPSPAPTDDIHGGDGMDPMPSDHEDDMDMAGEDAASPSTSADPHGHGDATPAPAMDGMDGMAPESGAPAEPEEGHGHGEDTTASEPKPREAVMGGFLLVNGLVLAGAAVTRRRDRARATAKALASASRKDASR